MKWNSFFNDLLFYIVDLYPDDITHVTKRRLVQNAGMRPGEFRYTLNDRDLWYTIIDFAIRRNRIEELLTAIIADVGPAPDEYLNGALQAITAGKLSRDPDVPEGSWKSAEAPKVTKEKIIGKRSNLLPVGFLQAGSKAARAVVRLELEHETGTGFLAGNGWLLTNNHLLPDVLAARSVLVQFNFQSSDDEVVSPGKILKIRPEKTLSLDPGPGEFYTDTGSDWTIVKLRTQDREIYEPYGFLSFSKTPAAEGDFVNIIQHPLGGPKQLGIYNNMVVYADGQLIQYLTDTNDGSSGSPVMNSNWEVVAIHHSGGWVLDAKSGATVKRNQGAPIAQVADKLFELNR